MAEDFCRLCLRPVDKANCAEIKKDEAKQEMFSEFFPELNIDLSANPTLCNECALNLEVSSNFKQGVLENEARIESELAKSKSKAKKKKIDLKTLLDAETKNELKSDLSICRTCLAICKDPSIRLYEAKTNVMPYSFVKKMCVQIFELEFTNSDKPVMCDECWETLQNAYDFRKNCLKTEKKITSYCQENKLTILGEIDLKKLNSLPANEDDSEMSDDDDFGDVDIKEEIFDPNDPDLSNPGSSSSSLQHVKLKKEEDGASGSVSVKSESGMDDEDEDMGDHPDLVDPNNLKSEEDGEGDDIDTKMEVGDTVKVDPEAAGAAGPSGDMKHYTSLALYRNKKRSASSRTKEKEMQSCTQCSYRSDRPGNLKRHMLIHAPEDTVPLFSCTTCSYKTKFKDTLQRHLLKHAGTSLLLQSGKGSVAPKSVEVLKCQLCSFKTIHKQSITAHMWKHAAPGSLPLWTCEICLGYKTPHKSRLNEHKLRHAAPGSDSFLKCEHCSFSTLRKRNLKTHMLRHTDKAKSLECAHCSYRTYDKRYLAAHLNRHSEQTYSCSICPFKSNYLKRLNDHIKLHSAPSFECEKCSYKAHFSYVLKRHMVVHEEPTFKCEQCPAKFRFKVQFKKHLLTHSPQDELLK